MHLSIRSCVGDRFHHGSGVVLYGSNAKYGSLEPFSNFITVCQADCNEVAEGFRQTVTKLLKGSKDPYYYHTEQGEVR